MAYNSAGPGPESERFLERTFKLRPQKPPTAVQGGSKKIFLGCVNLISDIPCALFSRNLCPIFLAIIEQVFGINPSTVRVTWRYVAPTVKEEPLTGYKVRI